MKVSHLLTLSVPRCCIVNAGAIGRDNEVGRSLWRLDDSLMGDPAPTN